jgi:hypothetical protein
MLDSIKARGTVNAVLKDELGNVKLDINFENLVVTTGLAYITSRMKDATATAMTHMAVGSSSTAAATGQTALQAELSGRAALTSTTVVTTTTTSDSIQYVATFGAGVGTGSVVEAGVFNAASAGTMLCRTVFGVITKNAGDSLTFTWKIKIS